MKKNQNLEVETILSNHRTCKIGKEGYIPPTAHERCDASSILKGDSAMVQGQDFNLVFGHSLQLSSGIYVELMIVSKYKA